MAPHEDIRLETTSGDPIAYFAPNAETNRSFDNELVNNALPGADTSALVMDFSQWMGEITVQGEFEHTDNLPQAHQNDVVALNSNWSLPVTAREQFNYLISVVVFEQQGPFHFYHEGDKYTAETQEDIDVKNNSRYPAVSVSQIQPALSSGQTREGYTVRFQIGVEQ